MKILIADALSDSAVAELNKLGAELRIEPSLGADDLPSHIGDADILVVRSTKVSSATIEAGKALSLIIRAGAGVNTIDIDAASDKGIYVANCPGKNADAVAELAIGLLIATDRRIVDNSIDLRNGVWNKKLYSKAAGLKGRTLGILGYGSIGQKTATIAKAMGMNVAVWSRSMTIQKAEAEQLHYCADPMSLAAVSDAVSIHLAVSSETKNLVDSKFLSAMKDGAYLINTSRGEIVDQAALESAMASKNLRVALDVYADEPAASAKEFPHTALAANITGTHHIGASTEQASLAIADEVVRIVATFMQEGKALNAVNARDKTTAPFLLVVRHKNKVGVLAQVLEKLKTAGINIEEMENSIFLSGKSAVASLTLDTKPEDAVIDELAGLEAVIQVSLK